MQDFVPRPIPRPSEAQREFNAGLGRVQAKLLRALDLVADQYVEQYSAALLAEHGPEVFAAAREHGVWLMEAFMYRFHPRTLRLAEIVAAGEIGAPTLIRASFGFTVADPANANEVTALGNVNCQTTAHVRPSSCCRRFSR